MSIRPPKPREEPDEPDDDGLIEIVVRSVDTVGDVSVEMLNQWPVKEKPCRD